jgi:hypothetical protein
VKKKYAVTGHVEGCKYLGVFEAKSPEEAVNMALESDAASVHLCHKCAGECEDGDIVDAHADEIKE